MYHAVAVAVNRIRDFFQDVIPALFNVTSIGKYLIALCFVNFLNPTPLPKMLKAVYVVLSPILWWNL